MSATAVLPIVSEVRYQTMRIQDVDVSTVRPVRRTPPYCSFCTGSQPRRTCFAI